MQSKILIVVLVILIISSLGNLYFTYKIWDYSKYFSENHYFQMEWDCNGDNKTDTISSSCDDIIKEELSKGCILKAVK